MDFAAAINAARAENDSGIGVRAGKKYTTVAVRTEIARRHFGPIGIATEIVHWSAESGAHIVVRATITSAEGAVLATGHAEEIRGQGQVNRTSALENAETSAIGRALAALGLSGGEFASLNEIEGADRRAGEDRGTPAVEPPPAAAVEAASRLAAAADMAGLRAAVEALPANLKADPHVMAAKAARYHELKAKEAA